MNLLNFLNFSHDCPICGEPLTLYMQWLNSGCFKAKPISEYTYRFEEHVLKPEGTLSGHILSHDGNEFLEGGINLNFWEDNYLMEFDRHELFNLALKKQIYFFFMCDPRGFKSIRNGKSYEIVAYRACYYRSSTLMEFKRNFSSDPECNGDWKLLPINPDYEEVINKHESFTLRKKSGKMEKVYILNLDDETKVTKLWYFTKSDNDGPKSKVFEKVLPPLITRPNLDRREALISRLDNWILMS